jgi:glycosyltransferase involved in cell wall biosynthesis
MSGSKNIIYRIFKKIDSMIIKNALNDVDFFVVISDLMVNSLKISHKPWIRIEGIYDISKNIEFVKKEKYKTILYTGTLDRRYGVLKLIRAFKSIESLDYRLWICGEGDSRKEIELESRCDSRILYLGQLSHNEVLILQRKATVLVNPRTSNGEFTKFSFPSKTMEYLASGTPTILYRLKGIPEEYFRYCYVIEGNDDTNLKEKIIEICEKSQDELNEIGERAHQFISEFKNPMFQIKKMKDLFDK